MFDQSIVVKLEIRKPLKLQRQCRHGLSRLSYSCCPSSTPEYKSTENVCKSSDSLNLVNKSREG